MSSEDFNFNPVIPEEKKVFTPDQLEDIREKFEENYNINLSNLVSKKGNLSYISFSDIWRIFRLQFPDGNFEILKNASGLPYFVDEELGILVFTRVTAAGQTYEMMLPVMDSSYTHPLKTKPYTVKVWDKNKKSYIDKLIPQASPMDCHKTALRCITKCISVGYGIALRLYQGQDFPEVTEDNLNGENANVHFASDFESMAQPDVPKHSRRRKSVPISDDPLVEMKDLINSMQSVQELVNLYRIHAREVSANPEIMAMFTKRREELEKAA